MNVYSMISKTGGNKKTSTLSNHREATPISLAPSQAKTKTFSHTLPFLAAEVRVWSLFYLELWPRRGQCVVPYDTVTDCRSLEDRQQQFHSCYSELGRDASNIFVISN